MKETVELLASLAQATRLEAFRRLVAAEPEGLAAGDLARALDVPQNTLSAHLAILSRAGLVDATRRGRSLIYRADVDRFRSSVAGLLEDCCGGHPERCEGRGSDLARRSEMPPVTHRPMNVLFLCTGNSARSVLAEAILRDLGGDRFRAFSAGSHPKGEIAPLAAKVLASYGHSLEGLRSKSWDEFAAPGAPAMDFVFTVCDSAAGEACPVWPGQPVTAHWGIEDPAAVEGVEIERERAFVTAYRYMKNRIAAFVALPLDRLDAVAIDRDLAAIGRLEGATAAC
ncbi:MAG: metalloregulator ArsR/SmtB family transcription factor [Hyphomicrobiales bacterium]|nr:metalloregulator ArsR/SmtB family transcription factor [Hyphomicrobiales bacterium]